MNGFQYAVAAWLPILIFPQVEGPTFRKGFPSTFGFTIAAIICVCVIQCFVVWERRRKASDAQDVQHPSLEGSVAGADAEKLGVADTTAKELKSDRHACV